MAETKKLEISLMAAGQAQKHVTVNEGFSRLDALVQLAVKSFDAVNPPGSSEEGDVHAIGAGATNVWSGQEGKLAIYQNGGWVFVTPVAGWQGWSEVKGSRIQFDGTAWIEGAGSMSANGAGFVHRTTEIDHNVGAGSVSVVSSALPENAVVYGVTARVMTDIGGATSLEIGVSGSSDRYGNGIGTSVGSWARGITGTPMTYYSTADLLLTASGGNFDGTGQIRLAVHFAELTLPRA